MAVWSRGRPAVDARSFKRFRKDVFLPALDLVPTLGSLFRRDEAALAHLTEQQKRVLDLELVATVKEFWIDGYEGYKAVCEVEYTLRDAEGKVLWTASVKGATGGMPMWGTSYAEEYLTKALAECAAHAVEQFKTSGFQKAVL